MIAATNGWLIALDNLSHLQDWLSDALCRLATGSGFATRELYTDAEEVLFAAQRPVVINGIEELATRGDLLDRSILLYLPTIPEGERQHEKDFWCAFEQARPRLLGALLDTACTALQNLSSIKLDGLPRMADFALWACAAAPALGWTAAEFQRAYSANRQAAHELALAGSLVADAILRSISLHGKWEGTASELLSALPSWATEEERHHSWPKGPSALSNTLRRLAPSLRDAGVEVMFARDGHRRLITLCSVSGPSKSLPAKTLSGDEKIAV